MKLAHFDFESIFNILPGEVNVLVLEGETEFFEYCSQLVRQISGGEGGFCLSYDDEILPISKYADIIYDYFSADGYDKKFAAKLFRSLQSAGEENFMWEYCAVCEKFAELFAKLNSESCCPVTYDEEKGMSALFKAFDVRIEWGECLAERLLTYIRAGISLLKTRVFFFVNLKSVLPPHVLSRFYHEAELLQTSIFLIENTQKPKLAGEKVTVLDRDLCETVA